MRYIDADYLDELITQLNREGRDITRNEYKMIDSILFEFPTADVVERKKGKWIWMGEKGDSRFMCSVCKSKENVPTCNGEPTIWWFCPNCGADMRKETENAIRE